MKKSYHSMAVPTKLPRAALRALTVAAARVAVGEAMEVMKCLSR